MTKDLGHAFYEFITLKVPYVACVALRYRQILLTFTARIQLLYTTSSSSAVHLYIAFHPH